jgi:uncharacterized protein YqgC (DUF456 family)
MVNGLLIIGCVVLMLIGLVGIVFPIIPDLILIWAAALGYGLIIDWGPHGMIYFVVISVLGLAGLATEFWVSGIGARKGGASGISILLGVVLAIVAFFLTGPIGAVVALLLGIYIVEYIRKRDVESASQAVIGAGLGCGASLIVKMLLGLGMIVTWVIWAFSS